jgi:hypothetical protein
MKKILFIVLLFSLFSCSTHKDSFDHSFKLSSEKDKELIISLQRTACFGTCPIYKIEIFSDGSGIYTGTRFVENIGVTKFSLSETQMNLILTKAEAIGFTSMKEEYSEPISDLPTTFIQIKDKKIRDYTGAPKTLKNLENLIDQLYQKAIKK